VKYCCSSSLGIFSPNLGVGANASSYCQQFLQSKRQEAWSLKQVEALPTRIKEQSMEYLILVAVVSIMALYAVIIVGCLKQPEW
jgi:hypothetical protein